MQQLISADELMEYDAIIFDMDGTLIDTMPVHGEAWKVVGKHFGYEFDSSIMYQLGGAPVAVIAEEIMRQCGMPLECLDDVLEKKREVSYELLKVKAQMLPTFELVKELYGKKPLALGTGSSQSATALLLNKFELHDYFGAVVTAADVKKHKPSPETFQRCAELLGITSTNCLVFEDADLGVEAALAAGYDVFDVRDDRLIKA